MYFRVCCVGILTIGAIPIAAQPVAPGAVWCVSRDWSRDQLSVVRWPQFPALQVAAGQPKPAVQVPTPPKTPAVPKIPPPPKRILGLVPNYRTASNPKEYVPLTAAEKFKMARQDSMDRGTFILAGLFGGEAQLTKATPSFGQGVGGFARYAAASYADFAIGDYMTEAIYPVMLHQDPRYFRRGTGSVISRIGYAASQIFWTRSDSGAMRFNYAEVIGNSTAVAISNAYYPDNRTASNAISKLAIQLGVDMAGNILKEFSPELNRVFSLKTHAEDPPQSQQ